MKKLILLFIFIPNILYAGSIKAIGLKGNEKDVDRVITVLMYDNYYKPNQIKIKLEHILCRAVLISNTN